MDENDHTNESYLGVLSCRTVFFCFKLYIFCPQGIYTAPTQEGFQIEQINEGGFRIVRIRNKNNTLPNTKDYPTAERTGTLQQTKGTKRSRDQITTTGNICPLSNCPLPLS